MGGVQFSFLKVLEKNLFTFVYLANKSRSSPILGLTIKSAEYKHNNVFVNKFVSMKLFFYNANMRLYLNIRNIISGCYARPRISYCNFNLT